MAQAPAAAACALLAGGCTSIGDWVHNGFKVGPNFAPPTAATAPAWVDADNPQIAAKPLETDAWWGVFHDSALEALIERAYRDNLDLKTAATRVFEAQAQRNIAVGNLFPQTQNAIGDYAHAQIGKNNPIGSGSNGNANGGSGSGGIGLPHTLDAWATGFNMSWELDFWGRLRRTVESNDATLKGNVEAYRDALVTLLANVATNYVQLRTYQERITFARSNVEIQKNSLKLIVARFEGGTATKLDVEQAKSTLAQTEASIPALEIGARQANNQLCILLGQPTGLLIEIGLPGPIPSAGPELAVGIPADLLARRPDVRRALSSAAAQSAQIGIAEADFYPRFGVSGFIGYTSNDIRHLFEENSFTGYVLPNFQWKILNYGRIQNNVRQQEATFNERVLQYQSTVLTAGREVEDGLIGFVQYQRQIKSLEESVRAAESAVKLTTLQFREGRIDYNQINTVQSQLVAQQDQLATARGNVALSLINVYRALGGGWQTFEQRECKAAEAAAAPVEKDTDTIPQIVRARPVSTVVGPKSPAGSEPPLPPVTR